MTTLTEANTREDLAECLRNLCDHAKRQPHVVRKLTTDRPTLWDVAHEQVNDRLDEYEAARR